jgi:hypothetical protein
MAITLMMEIISASETFVNVFQITRSYILGDSHWEDLDEDGKTENTFSFKRIGLKT